jgi:hypothetical protein
MSEQSTESTAETPSPAAGAAFASFVDYRKAVREIATDLSTLRGYAGGLGLNATAAQIASVIERLEADKFSVAVVGEFKRGKSTFINALLGADALPTDVLPCSATLNRVTYGLQKRVVLEFHDGRKQEIPFESLSDHVTKLTEESEELARSIANATVHYPSPYCQNNVDVIDTPGLNDDDSMTSVTLSVLPEVDAAILVIRAQSPFSEYERQFLETRLLSADLGRVLFVVNGIDQLNSAGDADRVLQAIEKRLSQNVLQRAKRQYGEGSDEYQLYVRKVGKLRVYGISAFQALEGKLRNDHDKLQQSRFAVFERELQRFLTEGRGAVTLQVPLNRALSSAGELLATLHSHEASLELKRDEFERIAADSEAEVQSLRAAKAQEMSAIDRTAQQLQQRMGALAEGFVSEAREAVVGTIERAEIAGGDISGKDARKTFDQRITKDIAAATAAVVDSYATKLQREIEGGLARAAEQLEGFDLAINGLLGRISQRFEGVGSQSDPQDGGSTAASILVSGFTGALVGGMIGGYRSAGWKGAGVGAVTSVGVVYAGISALALIGAPLTIPAVAVLGVASFFTGRFVSDSIFRQSKIENYRKKLRDEAVARLDAELSVAQVREHFRRTADQALAQFRERVESNVDAVLQDATATLVRLREQYAEGKTRTAAEIESALAMRREIELIAERGHKLSRQLAAQAAEA